MYSLLLIPLAGFSAIFLGDVLGVLLVNWLYARRLARKRQAFENARKAWFASLSCKPGKSA